MSNYTEVLFSKGPYDVRVHGGKYIIVNRITGVVEHETPVLYEAIRLARSFENLLNDATAEPSERGTKKERPFDTLDTKTIN